jgi:2-polyprenyl-3-methyl-5-hydroxy-6-metoxy-1,4-benzoquinol methylase
MLVNSESPSISSTAAERNQPTVKVCVNCGHASFIHLFDGYDFDSGKKHFALEKCSNCQLTRTSPVLNEAELATYYDIGYYGSSTKKFNSLIEAWTIWSNNRLAKKILSAASVHVRRSEEPVRVLDIGCGRANLLKAFKRNGCQCFGVERSDFPEDPALQDINIFKQDFLDVTLEENSFDIVVIWHVLEHLTDPASTLKKVGKILKPDGKLIVAVPNFGGLQSRLFGKHWFHLDLPRHTYHFTGKSINSLVSELGFVPCKIKTWSFDQSVFGFIQSTINILGITKPNTLFLMLKLTPKQFPPITVITHFLLATILFPVALIEYLFAGLINRGVCLIMELSKGND